MRENTNSQHYKWEMGQTIQVEKLFLNVKYKSVKTVKILKK